MGRGSEGETTGQQVHKQSEQQFLTAPDLLCTPEVPVMYGTHRSPACSALHHLLNAPVHCVMQQQLHWLVSYLSIPKRFSLQLGCIILITIVCFVNNHQICSVPSERE